MRASTFLALVFVASACDPVNSDAVDALGGEAPGVRTGPTHRPGQPCLLCHDGSLGNPPEFSVAGTVFQDATGRVGASGAIVTLKGADGATRNAWTNSAGNFYLTPNEYSPVYPLAVSVQWSGTEKTMTTLVNGSGACATCHSDPAGPSSAGHIYASGAGGEP